MLIEHLVDVGAGARRALGVGDLDAFYKEATTKFADDDEFRERARRRVVLLQSGDAETLALWRTLVAQSADALERRLRQARRAADRRRPGGGEPLRRADARGRRAARRGRPARGVRRRRGRVPARLHQPGGRAAAADRAQPRRRLHLRHERPGVRRRPGRAGRCRPGCSTSSAPAGAAPGDGVRGGARWPAGWCRPAAAEHVAFGNVLGTDRKMLRSRSGEPVKFVDVRRRGDRAWPRRSSPRRTPTCPPSSGRRSATRSGIGALKYADLSTDRIRDYVFDWDRMLSFDGNTAPYLQYAHARICSIFRRAGIDRASVRATVPVLGEPQERALAMRVLGFGAAVRGDRGAVQPAPAVHLPVRAGVGLHRLLRALPGAEGTRCRHPGESPGVERRDRPGAGAGVTSARDRCPRADVGSAAEYCLRR